MGNSIEMKLFERFAAPAIIQKFYFWFDGRLLNGIYLWINEKINEMKQCCSRNLKSWMEWKLFNEGKASCGCGKQTFLQLNGNEIEGKCGPLQAAKGGRSQSTNHQTSQFKALNELWNVWFGVVDGEWSPAEQPTLFLLSSAKTKSCLWWRRERSCCGASASIPSNECFLPFPLQKNIQIWFHSTIHNSTINPQFNQSSWRWKKIEMNCWVDLLKDWLK